LYKALLPNIACFPSLYTLFRPASSQTHMRAHAQYLNWLYCPAGLDPLLPLGRAPFGGTGHPPPAAARSSRRAGPFAPTSAYMRFGPPGASAAGAAGRSPLNRPPAPRWAAAPSGEPARLGSWRPRLGMSKSLPCFPVTPTDTLIDLAPDDFGRVVISSLRAGLPRHFSQLAT